MSDTESMRKDEFDGIITKGVGGLYTIRLNSGEYVNANLRGVLRTKKLTPAIGDNVCIGESGDKDVPYVINKIGDRKSFLIRPPVANIDYLILTFAVKDPQPDLLLLDKMLIICKLMSIEPIIVFTKCDLDEKYAEELYNAYSKAGYITHKSYEDNMLDASCVKQYFIQNRLIGLAGPSGVGKSTLVNHFLQKSTMETGQISDRLKRGKHTTRHVELLEFEDGFLLDTPGFTSLSLYELGVDYKNVILGFPELEAHAKNCKFDDCRHQGELGCSIADAISEAIIDEGRVARYRELELDLYNNRNNYSGRRKLNL